MFRAVTVARIIVAALAVLFVPALLAVSGRADVPCAVTPRPVTVRGNSLTGVLEPGTDVTILEGYYACHDVERGDIVAVRIGHRESPLVKIARGIPGDTFALTGHALFINGHLAKTSGGVPYMLNDQAVRMLSLYQSDYHSTIPPDTYLLLGNLATGSLDSTRFGLVGKADIVGKVVRTAELDPGKE